MRPDPKHKRIKLTPSQMERLKQDIRDERGPFCEKCGRFLPLHGGILYGAHFHHKKSRGAGGDDTTENFEILCWACHIREHS